MIVVSIRLSGSWSLGSGRSGFVFGFISGIYAKTHIDRLSVPVTLVYASTPILPPIFAYLLVLWGGWNENGMESYLRRIIDEKLFYIDMTIKVTKRERDFPPTWCNSRTRESRLDL